MKATVSFYTAYLLCLVLSMVCVVLVIYWNATYREGFSWDGKNTQFNWHPVLMVIGLVVLYGNGEGQSAYHYENNDGCVLVAGRISRRHVCESFADCGV